MTARRLPGRTTTCQRCGQPMTWARTLAGEGGRGGKAMPLDPFEDLAGNVAVRATDDRGSLVARVLRKDELRDRTTEYLAMPHAATCRPPDPQLPIEPERPSNVLSFDEARRRRGAHPRG